MSRRIEKKILEELKKKEEKKKFTFTLEGAIPRDVQALVKKVAEKEGITANISAKPTYSIGPDGKISGTKYEITVSKRSKNSPKSTSKRRSSSHKYNTPRYSTPKYNTPQHNSREETRPKTEEELKSEVSRLEGLLSEKKRLDKKSGDGRRKMSMRELQRLQALDEKNFEKQLTDTQRRLRSLRGEEEPARKVTTVSPRLEAEINKTFRRLGPEEKRSTKKAKEKRAKAIKDSWKESVPVLNILREHKNKNGKTALEAVFEIARSKAEMPLPQALNIALESISHKYLPRSGTINPLFKEFNFSQKEIESLNRARQNLGNLNRIKLVDGYKNPSEKEMFEEFKYYVKKEEIISRLQELKKEMQNKGYAKKRWHSKKYEDEINKERNQLIERRKQLENQLINLREETREHHYKNFRKEDSRKWRQKHPESSDRGKMSKEEEQRFINWAIESRGLDASSKNISVTKPERLYRERMMEKRNEIRRKNYEEWFYNNLSRKEKRILSAIEKDPRLLSIPQPALAKHMHIGSDRLNKMIQILRDEVHHPLFTKENLKKSSRDLIVHEGEKKGLVDKVASILFPKKSMKKLPKIKAPLDIKYIQYYNNLTPKQQEIEKTLMKERTLIGKKQKNMLKKLGVTGPTLITYKRNLPEWHPLRTYLSQKKGAQKKAFEPKKAMKSLQERQASSQQSGFNRSSLEHGGARSTLEKKRKHRRR